MTVSEAIAKSALERKESRGGHFRDDFPEKKDEFSKFNHIIKKGKKEGDKTKMKPFTELSDPEVKSLVAYIRSFKK